MSSWQKVKKRGTKKDKFIDTEINGTFVMSSNGFAFIKDTNNPEIREVFISKSFTENAINGDIVKVLIIDKGSKGYDGKVISLIKRKYNKLYAIINHTFKGNFILYAPILGRSKSIYCTPYSNECLVEIGDRVCVEILNWGTCNHDIHGKILENYGNINDISKDMRSIIADNNIVTNNCDIEINDKHDIEYNNLEDLYTYSINNRNILYSLYKEGTIYNLFVHLPNISEIKNINEIFKQIKFLYREINFIKDSVPFLPKNIHNHLSFEQNKSSRAITLKYSIDENNFEIININIFQSIIRLNIHFNNIDELKKNKVNETDNMLNLIDSVIKKHKNNNDNQIIYLSKPNIEYNEKIYEFNYDVCTKLDVFNLLLQNFIIHNFKINDLIYGEKFILNPNSKDIQHKNKNIFEMLNNDNKDEENREIININKNKNIYYSLIRNKRKDLFNYIPLFEPLENYVSLINLNNLINGDKNNIENLENMVYKINKTEKLILKVENEYINLQKIRYFNYLEEKLNNVYNVIITKIKPYAIFFIHKKTLYEDSIHVSNLGGKRYTYNNNTNILVSVDNDNQFELGQEINLKIEKIDIVKNEIKWIYSC